MKIVYRSEGDLDVIELTYSVFELDKINFAIQAVRRVADIKIETYGFIFKRMVITGTPEQIKIAGKVLARRYTH
ncbi:tryptophan synthase subunit alpha [Xenorhabdus bovienii]|uniref:tryptophan synthase subunit alpha n=1 Tax=Xenorhabdus bovienii TaxID=40576 RepID=UPI001EDE1A7C|nr:tryptophan synthase subunit alpha [Xenorhabdus bovienii]MCG3462531.1 tryptophan synthase subunit alpha [Xenorhabdus bovienii]